MWLKQAFQSSYHVVIGNQERKWYYIHILALTALFMALNEGKMDLRQKKEQFGPPKASKTTSKSRHDIYLKKKSSKYFLFILANL